MTDRQTFVLSVPLHNFQVSYLFSELQQFKTYFYHAALLTYFVGICVNCLNNRSSENHFNIWSYFQKLVKGKTNIQQQKNNRIYITRNYSWRHFPYWTVIQIIKPVSSITQLVMHYLYIASTLGILDNLQIDT